MRIFTTTGFVSAVFKNNALQVRAHDRRSLQALAKQTGAKIISKPRAEHPFRIEITNEQFSKWLSEQAMDVNYKKLKSELADDLGHGFAKPLSRVWPERHGVEHKKVRVR